MGALSKYFTEITVGKNCHELIHPFTKDCNVAFRIFLLRIFIGTMKCMFPLCFVPLALNLRNGSKDDFKKSLILYVRVVFSSYLSVLGAVSTMCVFYNLFGFHKYTFCLIPGFIGGFIGGFQLPIPLARIHSHAFFNMGIEVLIRGSKNSIIQYMRTKKIFGTFFFMITSSIVMHILRLNRVSMFWFIQPIPISKIKEDQTEIAIPSTLMDQIVTTEKQICSHKNSCDKYIIKGILTYVKYGFGLDIMKRIFSNFHLIQKNPLLFLQNILQNTNYNFLKFLMVYAGLYRFSNCICNRYFQKDTVKGNIISSLLGGLSYYFCPNYYFFTLPFATAIQGAWLSYLETDNPSKICKRINEFPLSAFFYTFTGGAMVHVGIFFPEKMPKFARRLINTITANLMSEVTNRLEKIMTAKNIKFLKPN